jgi:hypothetical protein
MDLDFCRYVRPARMGQKKLMKKLSCWLRTDKVFVYFMRLKTRALKYAAFWPRECRQQVQKMGHRFRADVHKITSFFSAAVPRLFGHGGFCLKIGGMATAAAGAEHTPGTAHEVAGRFATKVANKVASQFKLRHPLHHRAGWHR